MSPRVRALFKVRQRSLLSDPYNSQLHFHMLSGEYDGLYSINITGDRRVLFEKVDNTYVVFGFMGTHIQLYG